MSDGAGRGREAFARHAWAEAYRELLAVADLDAEDCERLAVAAHLIGEEGASADAWEKAYGLWSGAGETAAAARCAVWLGTGLMLRGELATASGWIGRAKRLVDEGTVDGPVTGFVLVPAFLQALTGGDLPAASALAERILATGRRFDDPDLLALGLLSQGQVMLARGDVDAAMILLDEAMVAVTADELSPIFCGIVYCAVIEACVEALDLRRAAEWTEALTRWCANQPDLVPYRGQCLVHRSQVLLAHGSWSEAEAEAERAREHLSRPAHPALGMAMYQRAELHRLRGELDRAERAYRSAHDHGQDPAPGLALLRLAQGRAADAAASIRRMIEEHHDPLARAPMLAAATEIRLAAADPEGARSAATELTAIAAGIDAPMLHAMASYAEGSVALHDGDPAAALEALRRAQGRWRQLQMPYEAARAKVLIGRACAALGDLDTAELELASARATFDELGAAPDAARAAPAAAPSLATASSILTEREREVIRLVAAGKTNRAIAADLTISEHTVGRHLENIFHKLGLSSRAAATAYAYEHGLV